jgi:hypothetical protein
VYVRERGVLFISLLFIPYLSIYLSIPSLTHSLTSRVSCPGNFFRSSRSCSAALLPRRWMNSIPLVFTRYVVWVGGYEWMRREERMVYRTGKRTQYTSTLSLCVCVCVCVFVRADLCMCVSDITTTHSLLTRHFVTYCSMKHSASCPPHHSLLTAHLFIPNMCLTSPPPPG